MHLQLACMPNTDPSLRRASHVQVLKQGVLNQAPLQDAALQDTLRQLAPVYHDFWQSAVADLPALHVNKSKAMLYHRASYHEDNQLEAQALERHIMATWGKVHAPCSLEAMPSLDLAQLAFAGWGSMPCKHVHIINTL